MYLLVPYPYIFIESINCILASLLKLNAILLNFSIDTLCFSLLNLYLDFDVNLLFFVNSSWFLWDHLLQYRFFFLIFFFIFKFICCYTTFMVFEFEFLFYETLFCAFCSFIFITIIYLIAIYFLLSMQRTLSLFFPLIHPALVQLLFYFFLLVMVF